MQTVKPKFGYYDIQNIYFFNKYVNKIKQRMKIFQITLYRKKLNLPMQTLLSHKILKTYTLKTNTNLVAHYPQNNLFYPGTRLAPKL